MPSFLGIKFGSDKKKAQKRGEGPNEWNEHEQISSQEGQFIDHTFTPPGRPLERPGTSYSSRSTRSSMMWRAPYTGNVGASSSMVDLAPPSSLGGGLRHHASETTLKGPGSRPNISGPIGPPRPLALDLRPSSSAGKRKDKDWVNPLEMLGKGAFGSRPSTPREANTPARTAFAPVDTNPTDGRSSRSTTDQSRSTTELTRGSTSDHQPHQQQREESVGGANGYPSPPPSVKNSEGRLSPVTSVESKAPTTRPAAPSSLRRVNTADQQVVASPRTGPPSAASGALRRVNTAQPTPTSLPSPAVSEDQPRWDGPVIRNVQAKRDTMTFYSPRRRSFVKHVDDGTSAAPRIRPQIDRPEEEKQEIKKRRQTEGFEGNFAAFDFGGEAPPPPPPPPAIDTAVPVPSAGSIRPSPTSSMDLAESPYDSRGQYGSRNPYDVGSPYDSRGPSDSRPSQESRNPYDSRGPYDPRPQESRNPYNSRGPYDARPSQESKSPYDSRNPYETRGPYDSRGSQESRRPSQPVDERRNARERGMSEAMTIQSLEREAYVQPSALSSRHGPSDDLQGPPSRESRQRRPSAQSSRHEDLQGPPSWESRQRRPSEASSLRHDAGNPSTEPMSSRPQRPRVDSDTRAPGTPTNMYVSPGGEQVYGGTTPRHSPSPDHSISDFPPPRLNANPERRSQSPLSRAPIEGDFPVVKGLPRGRRPGPPPPIAIMAQDLRPRNGEDDGYTPTMTTTTTHDDGSLSSGWPDLMNKHMSAIPPPLSPARPQRTGEEDISPWITAGPTSPVAPRLPSPTFPSLEKTISSSSENLARTFELAARAPPPAPYDGSGPLGSPLSGEFPGSPRRVDAARAPPRPAPVTLPPSQSAGGRATPTGRMPPGGGMASQREVTAGFI